MANPKVTVVGAGFVGATTAQRLVEKDIADVVLIDVVEGLPQGKALDMMESAPVEGFRTRVFGTNDYADTKDSDVIVITAGLARKPGMSRDDLLAKNAEIVGGIVDRCAEESPRAVIIVVTNPLDAMTYLAWKRSGFPANRVFGMAGVLDSSRYGYFLSEELLCPPGDVDAIVFGGHGDDMVPVPQFTKVKGKPVTELLPADVIEKINQRTRDGGAEIVALLKTGSAYYAPSASAVKMVKSVVQNAGEVMPCCVYLTGQYGLRDVYCGVPARLGREGVLEIPEWPLTEKQRIELAASAVHVQENCSKLKL